MKQYTIGKKAAVIVLHQLCMILMVTGVFATGYAFRHDAHENIDIYTLISLAGLVGSFVSLAYMANVAGRKSEDEAKGEKWLLEFQEQALTEEYREWIRNYIDKKYEERGLPYPTGADFD